MNTIYIPQRITTLGQAKALPVGTVATSEDFTPEVFVKTETNTWLGTHGPGAFTDQAAVGFDALIPTTTVHEIARELSDSNDRGWHASIGDELLEALEGRPRG